MCLGLGENAANGSRSSRIGYHSGQRRWYADGTTQCRQHSEVAPNSSFRKKLIRPFELLSICVVMMFAVLFVSPVSPARALETVKVSACALLSGPESVRTETPKKLRKIK